MHLPGGQRLKLLTEEWALLLKVSLQTQPIFISLRMTAQTFLLTTL